MNVSELAAKPFQWGSAIRRARSFHPDGVIAEGSIERVAPAGEGLPIESSPVVARVSKAVGTPGPLPDFIGLAVRITRRDATAKPWDILFVTAASGVLSRAVALRPALSWSQQTMTTLMPLRYQDANWWLRARIETEIGGVGLSLDGVAERVERGGIAITIDQARGARDFTRVAQVELTGVAHPWPGDDVSFDPVVNTGPGLQLYPGWLADLRGRAYRRSRVGRDAQ
jgi:hypothetical protein